MSVALIGIRVFTATVIAMWVFLRHAQEHGSYMGAITDAGMWWLATLLIASHLSIMQAAGRDAMGMTWDISLKDATKSRMGWGDVRW